MRHSNYDKSGVLILRPKTIKKKKYGKLKDGANLLSILDANIIDKTQKLNYE